MIDWQKLRWHNWPYWVRGGAISGIVGIFGFLYVSQTLSRVGPPLSRWEEFLDFARVGTIFFMVFFPVGAAIGYLYGKLKEYLKRAWAARQR